MEDLLPLADGCSGRDGFKISLLLWYDADNGGNDDLDAYLLVGITSDDTFPPLAGCCEEGGRIRFTSLFLDEDDRGNDDLGAYLLVTSPSDEARLPFEGRCSEKDEFDFPVLLLFDEVDVRPSNLVSSLRDADSGGYLLVATTSDVALLPLVVVCCDGFNNRLVVCSRDVDLGR